MIGVGESGPGSVYRRTAVTASPRLRANRNVRFYRTLRSIEFETDSIVSPSDRRERAEIFLRGSGFGVIRIAVKNNFDEFSSTHFIEYLLGQGEKLTIVKIAEVARHGRSASSRHPV